MFEKFLLPCILCYNIHTYNSETKIVMCHYNYPLSFFLLLYFNSSCWHFSLFFLTICGRESGFHLIPRKFHEASHITLGNTQENSRKRHYADRVRKPELSFILVAWSCFTIKLCLRFEERKRIHGNT